MIFYLLGFSVLECNYTGSVGFGQKQIDRLLSIAGLKDAKDIYELVIECCEQELCNPKMVVSMGGSHGGFLTAHMCSQYYE